MALMRRADDALEVVELASPDALALATPEWDRVVAGCSSPNVFLTAEWLRTWWTHFGAGRELCLLLIRRPGGDVVGAAPFMITPHGAGILGLQALEFVGADVPTCADHMEVACTPGMEQPVGEAVAHYLLHMPRRWDVAHWVAVAEGSNSMNSLGASFRSHGRRTERVPFMPSPYLRLGEPWAAYDQHLHRKFRDLRKYLAAVERRERCFLLVQSADDLERMLPELRRLSQLRVRSKGGQATLERGDVFAFIADISRHWLPRGLLRLYSLEVEGRVVAVNLNFAYGSKVYGYMSGFDPAWTRHGIGTVLMRHVIRASLEEGFQEYDFLRGNEDYKYRWTSVERSASTLRVVNRRVRFWGFTGRRLAASACARLLEGLSRRNGSQGAHRAEDPLTPPVEVQP